MTARGPWPTHPTSRGPERRWRRWEPAPRSGPGPAASAHGSTSPDGAAGAVFGVSQLQEPDHEPEH